MPKEQEELFFTFPSIPEFIPGDILNEATNWRGLDDFEILVRAEEVTGLCMEIRYSDLPPDVWGIHLVRGERGCLCINKFLPSIWRHFALLHELYHLIAHPRSVHFWAQTYNPLSRFEREADDFAWAVLKDEWENLTSYSC